MATDILLVHKNTDLLTQFQKEFEKNGTTVHSAKTVKNAYKKDSLPFVVIDTEGDWDHALNLLQKIGNAGREFYTIISSPEMLKKTIAQIHETALNLNRKADHPKDTGLKGVVARGHEPSLAELIEKKLAEFVRKTKGGQGKNLYNLLIEEFEKPLITLALRETEGNQIQAAQLLGMNRNTLRKKIKELKISVIKGKKR